MFDQQTAVTIFLFVLSGMGALVMLQMRGIKEQLSALPKIQVELAGMAVKVDQHGETLVETKNRLARVEEHVSNTERIALMESKLVDARKEIDGLRDHWHRMNEILGMVISKLELNVSQPKL